MPAIAMTGFKKSYLKKAATLPADLSSATVLSACRTRPHCPPIQTYCCLAAIDV